MQKGRSPRSMGWNPSANEKHPHPQIVCDIRSVKARRRLRAKNRANGTIREGASMDKRRARLNVVAGTPVGGPSQPVKDILEKPPTDRGVRCSKEILERVSENALSES